MPLLDHIVVLVPSLTEAISSYRAAGFTIIPGGAHAGGVTENALLILPDKVYLELIAFRSSTPPSERAKHRWGNRLPGLIDWAVAPGNGKTLGDELSRAQVGNLYEEPQPGGRTTPEGRVLEWETASPKQLTEQDPGVLPFFCADITPRDWRVPALPDAEAHRNSASGVLKLHHLVRSEHFSIYKNNLRALLDTPSFSAQDNSFKVSLPESGVAHIIVRKPKDQDEERWILQNGDGIYQIEIGVGDRAYAASADKFEKSVGARLELRYIK